MLFVSSPIKYKPAYPVGLLNCISPLHTTIPNGLPPLLLSETYKPPLTPALVCCWNV